MSRHASVLFGGDCHFGDKAVTLDPRLRERIHQAEFLVINQESPIIDVATPVAHKEIHLRSSTRAVECLRDLGVKVASLANNHIADYGHEGIAQTIAGLKGAGIAPVGAGADLSEASRPAYLELPNGQTVAFLAFTSCDIGSKIANERSYGCAELEPVAMERAISRARERASHVVLLLHYGLTSFGYPTPRDRETLRSFARRGIDLIIGHHPHVVQGWEIRDGVPIFYSLGNLIFASFRKRGRVVPLAAESRRGALIAVDFCSRGARIADVIYTETTEVENQLLLWTPQSSIARARSFEARSKPLAYSSYEIFFRRYSLKRLLHRLLLWTSPRRWRTFSGAQINSLLLSLSFAVGRKK
jgi:Bacterial capsule synthesis protein PGA_cap